MFKSVQIKIMLMLIIISIVMFAIPGFIYINKLDSLNMEENMEAVLNFVNVGKHVFAIIIVVFLIISGVILIFASKELVSPITKLIKSAEQITDNDSKRDKSNTEIDNLSKAFEVMTDGLKENLNEVTRQKKQIETILLHMTDGVIAFNLDGDILHINPAANKLLKITSKEDNFEKIFKRLNIDINLEKTIYLENWTSTEQKVNIDDKYINLFFAPFRDENDRPAGVIVVAQDITEHVKLDNMRKEFVADVSHELKTPLTSILGYAETLTESEYDKEIQKKFLGVISSEAVRMTKLVNDLLTLSRFDSNKKEWEKTEFDLGDLVKQCQENLQIEMDKKKQKVECFVTANVPKVYADKDGIERVVLNILSNSVKYTPDEGTIKIYVGFVYNDAYIKVIDSGIGIPEDDLNKIFERFYRVDKARTRQMGGTGLRIIYS